MNQETLFFVIAKKKKETKDKSTDMEQDCSSFLLQILSCNTVGFANTSVYYVQFSATTNTLFLSAKT